MKTIQQELSDHAAENFDVVAAIENARRRELARRTIGQTAAVLHAECRQ